jgi:O-antigen/teichoic acid export membrane protein
MLPAKRDKCFESLVRLISANFAFLVINLADRYLLKHLVGMEELGLYSLAFKFGALITFFIVTPLGLAWGPFMFGNTESPMPSASTRW